MTWDDRPGSPIDWWRVDRGLCETYGYKPVEIDDLTISEILMLSSDSAEARPHSGRGSNMTPGEIMDSSKRWQDMNAFDKIREAMRSDL